MSVGRHDPERAPDECARLSDHMGDHIVTARDAGHEALKNRLVVVAERHVRLWLASIADHAPAERLDGTLSDVLDRAVTEVLG